MPLLIPLCPFIIECAEEGNEKWSTFRTAVWMQSSGEECGRRDLRRCRKELKDRALSAPQRSFHRITCLSL